MPMQEDVQVLQAKLEGRRRDSAALHADVKALQTERLAVQAEVESLRAELEGLRHYSVTLHEQFMHASQTERSGWP